MAASFCAACLTAGSETILFDIAISPRRFAGVAAALLTIDLI
jgi:hypothetical protein